MKGTLLVPFLLVLTAFGAYTAHNSFADILLMLAATAVGIAAIRWDWPRAPLLLALVLGDIAERYLFLSYSLYEWTWLTRPLVLAFAAVTIAGVAWPFVRPLAAARHGAPASDTSRRGAVSVDLAITRRRSCSWRRGCCSRRALAVPHRPSSRSPPGGPAAVCALLKLGLDLRAAGAAAAPAAVALVDRGRGRRGAS